MNAWRDNPIAKHAPTESELKHIPEFIDHKRRRTRLVKFLLVACRMIVILAFVGGTIWILL